MDESEVQEMGDGDAKLAIGPTFRALSHAVYATISLSILPFS
jgi:hypothetical protein